MKFEAQPTLEPPSKEKEPEEEKKEGLRKCMSCGREFEGDPNTNEPFCPDCTALPEHPENVPL